MPPPARKRHAGARSDVRPPGAVPLCRGSPRNSGQALPAAAAALPAAADALPAAAAALPPLDAPPLVDTPADPTAPAEATAPADPPEPPAAAAKSSAPSRAAVRARRRGTWVHSPFGIVPASRRMGRAR